MPTIIPSEQEPQPVPGHPRWLWWRGLAGLVYARRPGGTGPPVVVRAHNWTALLGRIRAEDARREGEQVARVALDLERDELERRFPDREVWWRPELAAGNGRRITWHSRPRGALNADLHADSAGELAERITGTGKEKTP